MRDHVKIGFSAMFGPSHTDIKGLTKEQVRDIYESELTKMRAERDELVAGIRWLDRWMGDKPMIHCANKVRASSPSTRPSD